MSKNPTVVDTSQIRDLSHQEIDSTSGGSPLIIALAAVVLLSKCQTEIRRRAAQPAQ